MIKNNFYKADCFAWFALTNVGCTGTIENCAKLKI